MSSVAGAPSPEVIASLDVPTLRYFERVGSTMDEAHALAEQGAAAGTVVLAALQDAGRGRGGRPWLSEADGGLWLTLIERPGEAHALDVLALRVGLALAHRLEPAVEGAITLKWPNDLLVARRKLGGVLIEVRWRDGRPEWVAIGVGINRRVPDDYPLAAALRASVSRDAVLRAVVLAIREAARARGPLDPAECEAFAKRDAAKGRPLREPVNGLVRGITPQGALLVEEESGRIRQITSGSLVFDD